MWENARFLSATRLSPLLHRPTVSSVATTTAPEARGPAVLVCATGGHLAQLHRLAPRIDCVGDDRLWVTFDTAQSRSLLAGEHTWLVPYTGPRDWFHTLVNFRNARTVLNEVDPAVVVSTGSAIAASFLPLARAKGIPTLYIESAARTVSPSLTGRMLELVPGVRRYTQYPDWGHRRWTYVGSVFDDYTAVRAAAGDVVLRKVVVTLGTIRGYGFPRLVERVRQLLPSDVEIVWQVGDTQSVDPSLEAVEAMPAPELAQHMREADVVVAHAGIGSALGALDAGRVPILVPRLAEFDEHVDDHQKQIASELERRGLALSRRVEELSLDDLHRAAALAVRQTMGGRIETGLAPA